MELAADCLLLYRVPPLSDPILLISTSTFLLSEDDEVSARPSIRSELSDNPPLTL